MFFGSPPLQKQRECVSAFVSDVVFNSFSSEVLSDMPNTHKHTHSQSLRAIVSHTAGHRVDCQLWSIISLSVLAGVCVFVQTCSQLRELVHGPVRAALFPFN